MTKANGDIDETRARQECSRCVVRHRPLAAKTYLGRVEQNRV
jgi:hypothetical protein